MLYCAAECARLLCNEGIDNAVARHALHGEAMLRGVQAMGLQVFGDIENKMNNVVGVYIPDEVDGDSVRAQMLNDFDIEIGTSFGPLHGKIWRIGTMGYNARKSAVLNTLASLDACLQANGYKGPKAESTQAALDFYRQQD
ncbi:MAG: alanine--glyoxylate aminotransferase family protein, partial [Pseudomonadales bacterium]|nr:alanine--glyoxylate aminotransferase family protein [Pseudomonadales bacterium]